MLRRTSKIVKEVVDKMRLPAVVRLSRSFWNDSRHDTEKEKRQFVVRQLAAVPHHHTQNVACRRSAGAVPSAGAP